MELEQCGRAEDRSDFRDTPAAYEQRGQSEHKSVEAGQIPRALSGTVNDHELMLEQQRFRGDSACATRAEEFRDGDEQVYYQEEQIAHQSNSTMTAGTHKTGDLLYDLAIRHRHARYHPLWKETYRSWLY